ncbi:L-threonylcarbamoyladenylate synthase [Winogradskyella sp. A2]|uniref:L-threonylcarbamoyladenylate synthase n=1 Tax=Winogradskyella sp. A2 TaxID=3366944 RepID=UPI00398C6490
MSIISTDISKAIELLNNEELVAIPTETVYGLAGNIYSEKAIKLIFNTKKRPSFNPLIVHIASKDRLSDIVTHIPEKAKLLADAFWPGPITLVLPKQKSIPNIITSNKSTVAVRVPNHPKTLELLKQLDFPLAAPSANPFSNISPTKPEHVENYFRNDIKLVLDGGPCTSGIESTIIGFENDEPIIYRLGSIPIEEIETIVGKIKVKNKKEVSPDAPGMLERHYAPKTATVLTDNVIETLKQNKNKRIGLITFCTQTENIQVTSEFVLSVNCDMNEAASKLYDALHYMDNKNLDIIIAEQFPNHGLGKSINDRLLRATKR